MFESLGKVAGICHRFNNEQAAFTLPPPPLAVAWRQQSPMTLAAVTVE